MQFRVRPYTGQQQHQHGGDFRSCRLHEDKEREVILQLVRHTQSEIVNTFG
jgi:hypothetical protein